MQRPTPARAKQANGEHAIGSQLAAVDATIAKLVAQGVIAPPQAAKLKPVVKPNGLTHHQEFVLSYVKDWITAEPNGPFILALAKLINDVDENHVPTNAEYAQQALAEEITNA